MDILEQLTKKVHQAADELTSLKRERNQLLSEIELLRANALKHNTPNRDVERYKKDREKLRTKFLKMQKKLEQIVSLHSNTPEQHEVTHENIAE